MLNICCMFASGIPTDNNRDLFFQYFLPPTILFFPLQTASLATLNNNLNGYSFGTTADGEPGFRKPGADTVIPFSRQINADTILNMVKNTAEARSTSVTYVVPSNKVYNFMFFGSNYYPVTLQVTKNGVNLPLIEVYNYCPLYDGCIVSVANSVNCVKGDKIVCTVDSTRGGSPWKPRAAILPY